MSAPWNPSQQPPPANGLLGEYALKRERAAQHLNALRESVGAFSNVEPEPVRGEFNEDASAYVFHVPLEPLDPDWVLLLGDSVYNFRSALNYFVTALVRSTGNEEDDGNEFPIYGIERRHWTTIDQWWEDDAILGTMRTRVRRSEC